MKITSRDMVLTLKITNEFVNLYKFQKEENDRGYWECKRFLEGLKYAVSIHNKKVDRFYNLLEDYIMTFQLANAKFLLELQEIESRLSNATLHEELFAKVLEKEMKEMKKMIYKLERYGEMS